MAGAAAADVRQSVAIKRASQQARNAMKELDAQGVEQLILLYNRAADEVRQQIYAAADASDRVPELRLRALLAAIDEVLGRLGEQRDELLQAQIRAAAELGVRPVTAQGVLAVGGTEAVLETGTAARISEAAVQFVVEMRQADGLVLSERLWRLNQGAKEALHRAIASAVIRGTSAARAAQDLAMTGQSIPGDMAQLARGGLAGNLAKLADILTSRDGGELWKAERVFRTEINRAHGEAFMAGAENVPGFAGFRFLLSPAHPEPDICDLLSAQNIHGLGPGVYPSRELTPWPAHPNTLSFLEVVFEDEISAADRAGKETELQALQRLAPEIREGVLGKTKAQYFDRGLLTKGMIRAKVSAVEQRIDRQAAAAARPHPAALHNWEYAQIPEGKLAAYALNPEHKGAGRDKARVFQQALGFGPGDAAKVEEQLLTELKRHPATKGREDEYGLRFTVDMPLQGLNGRRIVRTGWIYPPGSDIPQLVTLYVK